MNVLLGLLFHSIGGFASGSFYMPFNKVKGWAWESYWIVPWSLSNRGEVMLHGQRVPIIGRVSMDSMAIDLSAVPQAAVGDEVLLFGTYEGQTLRPEEVAARAGTIPYDLLVHVDSRRVQRLFRSE